MNIHILRYLSQNNTLICYKLYMRLMNKTTKRCVFQRTNMLTNTKHDNQISYMKMVLIEGYNNKTWNILHENYDIEDIDPHDISIHEFSFIEIRKSGTPFLSLKFCPTTFCWQIFNEKSFYYSNFIINLFTFFSLSGSFIPANFSPKQIFSGIDIVHIVIKREVL